MPILSSLPAPLGVSLVVIAAFGAAWHAVWYLVPKAAESQQERDGSVFRPTIPRQLQLASGFTISLAACMFLAWISQDFVARESDLLAFWPAFFACEAISAVIGGLVLRRFFHQESGPRLHLSSAMAGSVVLHVEIVVVTFLVGIVFTLETGI